MRGILTHEPDDGIAEGISLKLSGYRVARARRLGVPLLRAPSVDVNTIAHAAQRIWGRGQMQIFKIQKGGWG